MKTVMVRQKGLIYLLLIIVISIGVSKVVFVQAYDESSVRSNNRINNLAVGQQVYDKNCAVCHGTNGVGGRGDGHSAMELMDRRGPGMMRNMRQ